MTPPSAEPLRVGEFPLLTLRCNVIPFKRLASSHLVTAEEVGYKPIRSPSPSNPPTRLKGVGEASTYTSPASRPSKQLFSWE